MLRNLVALALANQVRHGVGAHQNFGGAQRRPMPDKRQQLLGDNAAQHGGQLAANLVLRTGRANVNDTVDGLRRADGVQRAHNQVAGLGGTVTAAEIVS